MMTFVFIVLLIWALILLFVVGSAFFGFVQTRVPFVPTYESDIEFVIKKLGISSKDVFYDLGSGNGKVVFLVSKLTGAECVGFELTLWTYLLSVLKLKWKNQNIKFKNQNFFKHPWTEANIVYGYLYPPLMSRVEEKFLADCKPGSIAIIRDFPFPNLKPVDVYFMPKKHEIYIYKKLCYNKPKELTQ